MPRREPPFEGNVDVVASPDLVEIERNVCVVASLESGTGGAVDHRADIYSLGRHRIGYPPS